jgi:hypothetical protein
MADFQKIEKVIDACLGFKYTSMGKIKDRDACAGLRLQCAIDQHKPCAVLWD